MTILCTCHRPLDHHLHCAQSLWELSCIGLRVTKLWARCVLSVASRQLATPGRVVRVRVGVRDAVTKQLFDDNQASTWRVVNVDMNHEFDGDDLVTLLDMSERATVINMSSSSGGSSRHRTARLIDLMFMTKPSVPQLEAKIRSEVTQGNDVKAAHMKHMTCLALKPCLPFVCHRCGCCPETVNAEFPNGCQPVPTIIVLSPHIQQRFPVVQSSILARCLTPRGMPVPLAANRKLTERSGGPRCNPTVHQIWPQRPIPLEGVGFDHI